MDVWDLFNCLILIVNSGCLCSSKVFYTNTPSGYVGCYEDYNGILQGGRQSLFSNNTVNLCKAFCQAGNYTYTGIKNGNVCSCGNSLNPSIRNTACNTECPGNKCENCGGINRLSLYITGPCRLHKCIFGPRCFKLFSDTSEKYTCDCNATWTGGLCYFNKDVNECHSNPCEKGTTCVDELDGFLCLKSGSSSTKNSSCQYEIKMTSNIKLTASPASQKVALTTSGMISSAVTSGNKVLSNIAAITSSSTTSGMISSAVTSVNKVRSNIAAITSSSTTSGMISSAATSGSNKVRSNIAAINSSSTTSGMILSASNKVRSNFTAITSFSSSCIRVLTSNNILTSTTAFSISKPTTYTTKLLNTVATKSNKGLYLSSQSLSIMYTNFMPDKSFVSTFLTPSKSLISAMSGVNTFQRTLTAKNTITRTIKGNNTISRTMPGKNIITTAMPVENTITRTMSGNNTITRTMSGSNNITRTMSFNNTITRTMSGNNNITREITDENTITRTVSVKNTITRTMPDDKTITKAMSPTQTAENTMFKKHTFSQTLLASSKSVTRTTYKESSKISKSTTGVVISDPQIYLLPSTFMSLCMSDSSKTRHTILPKSIDISALTISTYIISSTLSRETLSHIKTEAYTVSAVSPDYVRNDWMTIGDKQVRVFETPETYARAASHCFKLSSSLLAYTDPTQYFNKSLRLKNNTYWIDSEVGNECVCLSMTNDRGTIRLEACDTRSSFICARTANISRVNDDPKFIELINNMTINGKKTNKARRKLNSIQDKRLSAKFVGGIGVAFIFSCVVLVVLSDITCNKCKTEKVKK